MVFDEIHRLESPTNNDADVEKIQKNSLEFTHRKGKKTGYQYFEKLCENNEKLKMKGERKMKNDLTQFEKQLLKNINIKYNKKWTYRNLMEWATSKQIIEKNLQENESIYEYNGIYVAIRENEK